MKVGASAIVFRAYIQDLVASHCHLLETQRGFKGNEISQVMMCSSSRLALK